MKLISCALHWIMKGTAFRSLGFLLGLLWFLGAVFIPCAIVLTLMGPTSSAGEKHETPLGNGIEVSTVTAKESNRISMFLGPVGGAVI